VLIFNQRSLQEILDVIVALGRIVGRGAEAEALAGGFAARLDAIAARAAARAARPRGYFEEWDAPMISGIRWVSELIEIAGGRDVFAERSRGKGAAERTVTAEDVVAADPEVVFASWCGKPFDRAAFEARPGFGGLTAVRSDRVFEVPPEIILQPGPACLGDGLDFLVAALER
jgi:iron complex transport system substrate-binding protein